MRHAAVDAVRVCALRWTAGAAAAREHAGDADERHGNLLIVYDGRPTDGEAGLVKQCLDKVGG